MDGVPRLIEFLKRTFDARELVRLNTEGGRVGHAEVKIGGSIIMMADSNTRYSPIPSQLYTYVENVDEAFQRGLEAGGTSWQEPATQPYGDRTAAVRDPTGNTWWIATRVEEVSADDMDKRMKEQGLTGHAPLPAP